MSQQMEYPYNLFSELIALSVISMGLSQFNQFGDINIGTVMRNSSIKLNIDAVNMSWGRGSTKEMSSGKDEDYLSKIEMVLPVAFRVLPEGWHEVEYNGDLIGVNISTINSKETDPVFSFAKNVMIGASGSGFEEIPFIAFTDNRGEYPVTLATLIFPRRIASWIDGTQETGIKTDFDYERMQVAGSPDNEEKILALLVTNRLIKSLNIEGICSISYDDVTVFLETYYQKTTRMPLLKKINALASKNAYRNAVYDYVSQIIKKSGIDQAFVKFQEDRVGKQIDCEKDLQVAVAEVIERILKHYIESRRWIEPFWDGQRTIKHRGEEIVIPKSPKGETKIQPTLLVLLDMALSPLGIQVSRESDEGAGLLDFRFFFTTKNSIPLSVAAEFKVAHHKEIKKGINSQLPACLKAIRSTSGIFVVMWFKDSKFFQEPKAFEKIQMERWVDEEAKRVSSELGINLTTAMLDASIRPSASKLD